jgi:peptidoglycan/xylan/chitin deacetylase (PgdA/CDA1 family)
VLRRPLLNVLTWAVALGVALVASGAPIANAAAATAPTARAAAPGPPAGPPQPRARATTPPLVASGFHVLVQSPLLKLADRIPRPPPVEVPYELRPIDSSVPVFIPHGSAAPVPNALPGHSVDVTLTFDDCGSAAQIQAVVDALASVHRKGIFFITGQCRDHFPWLVATLQAGGHQVCNHTYSHPDLRRLSNAAIRSEIGRGVLAGCPYFRPPFGAWDGPRGRIARIAAEFGLQPMLWDIDSRDWAGAPAGQIATLAQARGGIVLLHLHGASTAEAIRLIG